MQRFGADVVQYLLDQRADVNGTTWRGETTLETAILHRRDVEIVRLLLQRGADIELQGEYGNALQTASLSQSTEMISLLVRAGAKINAEAGYYGDALQAACSQSTMSERVVRMLLEKGANVNAEPGSLGTALQCALYRSDLTPVPELLLDYGADVNAAKGVGVRFRSHPITRLLSYQKANATPLQIAVYFRREPMVRLLLERSAEVNATPGPLGTALQAARANTGYTKDDGIVELLLRHGAKYGWRGKRE
jgi:ankyrin repeat protein